MEKNVTKHYVWGQAITSFNWCLKFSGLQGNELELNIQKLRNGRCMRWSSTAKNPKYN